MQAVLDFINKHHYDIFIPLTALAVLRIIVCRAQLKKIASLREKKGAYHAVGGNYTEIGVWLGTLPGFHSGAGGAEAVVRRAGAGRDRRYSSGQGREEKGRRAGRYLPGGGAGA